MARHAAIRSAETLAALRAAAARDDRLAVACADRLAKHFLGTGYWLTGQAVPHRFVTWITEYIAPGSYCFTIARTRHFDDTLLAEVRRGAEQVVLLGAGYDSRGLRFERELGGLAVFEVDHPGTQERKRRLLAAAKRPVPANIAFVPVDFNRTSLAAALAAQGFSRRLRTVFLWEGVSYYLPRPIVEDVLDFVGGCSGGSSVVFDYALASFVAGDTSTFGGEQVARWLRRIGEPFLFGLNAQESAPFLAKHALDIVSDLGPRELEATYLRTRRGGLLGRTLGHVRIVHARTSDTL